MALSVRAATKTDIGAWLDLVAEAEPLFGSMPDFEPVVRRGIERRAAIVVTDRVDVLGGALLSRDEQPHAINWLYVRQSRRRNGAGTALMEHIVRRWASGNVKVVTFTEDTPGGQPARRLYERFGFVCCGRAAPVPDGSARDFFVLPR